MTEIPIDIGFYESSTSPLAAQNCINHYPQNPQTKGAISTGALFSTPGIVAFKDLVTGPGRGFSIFKNELYVIVGTSFYKISSTGIATNLGTIAGTDRVITAQNGFTICIQIPGGNGYFYDLTNGLQQITNAAYVDFQAQAGGVTSVTYKSGRFVFTTALEFFNASTFTVNLGQDFDALDFELASDSPDDNVLCFTVKNELYIMGTETIQLYQATGGTAPIFQTINGATISKGIAARHSVIEFDNSFVFIGGGPNESIAVWRGLSGSASKISTAAIDHAIQQYTQEEISNVFSWTYTEDGNFFVGFGFPDTTFVYDATTSTLQGRHVWHERQSNGSAWIASHVIDVYGKNYVLDISTGMIGQLDRNFTKEYAGDITRQFTGSYIYNMGQSFRIPVMELNTESGVGNQKGTGSGENPMVEALISVDGGRTFISLGSRPLGTFENFTQRQVWQRLGRCSTNALLRFITTGETIVNYTNLIIGLEGGA